ncbi:MAG: DUF2512 family protein [Bacillota bacterium]
MKATIAIIIKFVVIWAAAWISFSVFGYVGFYTVLTIAIAATVLNYLIGDLAVLPRLGNVIATILDGLLSAVTAYGILYYSAVTYYTMTSVLIFAVIVAVAEIFFHMYLVKSNIIKPKNSDIMFRDKKINFNTETGSELYPYTNKNDSGSRINNSNNYDNKNK